MSISCLSSICIIFVLVYHHLDYSICGHPLLPGHHYHHLPDVCHPHCLRLPFLFLLENPGTPLHLHHESLNYLGHNWSEESKTLSSYLFQSLPPCPHPWPRPHAGWLHHKGEYNISIILKFPNNILIIQYFCECLFSKSTQPVPLLICVVHGAHTSSVAIMPVRWKLMLLRLLTGCLLTWICLTSLARKQDSQDKLNFTGNNAPRKSNLSGLLEHRRSIVKEQCDKLKQQGRQRSSYIVPENFLTVKR